MMILTSVHFVEEIMRSGITFEKKMASYERKRKGRVTF